MKNQDIRDLATKSGLKLWQIAERFGCNDCNFSRKLRKEFDNETKEKIIKIIYELQNERTK